MKLVHDPLRGISTYKSSAIALILANTIPLVGVVFFEWGAFSVVALYWVETVIIGVIHVAKMIVSSPTATDYDIPESCYTPQQIADIRRELHAGRFQIGHHLSKLILVPLFIGHFGMFCLVLGAGVYALFGQQLEAPNTATEAPDVLQIMTDHYLWWPSLALTASHLFSFFRNFLGRGEYRQTIAALLMYQPYQRLCGMLLLIAGVTLLATWFETTNTLMLTVMIILKEGIDLYGHLRERERNSQPIDSKLQKRSRRDRKRNERSQ
jgi:hypothetical protein